MTTYTAAQFAQSPAFMAIAVEDALKLVAKTNGQTFELACEAFEMEVPSVMSEVSKLVAAACQYCAAEANAGRMWA